MAAPAATCRVSDDLAPYVLEAFSSREFEDYYLERVGEATGWQELTCEAVTESGERVGAIHGNYFYGGVNISRLCIVERYRSSGIGGALLRRIIARGYRLGARIANLETLEYQGPHYYPKFGFFNDFTVAPVAGGHSILYFAKQLGEEDGRLGPDALIVEPRSLSSVAAVEGAAHSTVTIRDQDGGPTPEQHAFFRAVFDENNRAAGGGDANFSMFSFAAFDDDASGALIGTGAQGKKRKVPCGPLHGSAFLLTLSFTFLLLRERGERLDSVLHCVLVSSMNCRTSRPLPTPPAYCAVEGMQYWGMVHITGLIISKAHRLRGVGVALMHRVEAYAASTDAVVMCVETFDFQVRGCGIGSHRAVPRARVGCESLSILSATTTALPLCLLFPCPFQSPGFYEKLGWKEVLVRGFGWKNGAKMHYYTKPVLGGQAAK